MSKNPNPPQSLTNPIKVSKRTSWLPKVTTDSEIKDFDDSGLFLICAICPPMKVTSIKIKTRAGRPFDLTRWNSHCETISHKEARKQKAHGKGPGIKSFFVPKKDLQPSLKKSATGTCTSKAQSKINKCRGIYPDKSKLVELFSRYGNPNDLNLSYISDLSTDGILKSQICLKTTKYTLDKRRNSIPNCDNCFAIQNDKNFRKRFA